MSTEKKVQSFTQKELKAFLAGTIEEEFSPVPATVVVLLELVKSGLYFVPGYKMMHRTMLAELGGEVNDVGFAGRLAYSEMRNVIELHDGGTTIDGYVKKNYRETKEKLDGWLAEIGDKRKIQFPRY